MSHTDDSSMRALTSKERSVFLVLEGGGAKGIVHVGALAAIEHTQEATSGMPPLRIQAVAGSSIGAVVAAFIAAGAKSDELIDKDGRLPLAVPLGIDYFTDVFDRHGWRRIKVVRWFSRSDNRMALLTIAIVLVIGLAYVVLKAFFSNPPLASIYFFLWLGTYYLAKFVGKFFRWFLDFKRLSEFSPWINYGFALSAVFLVHQKYASYLLEAAPARKFGVFVFTSIFLITAFYAVWFLRRLMKGLVATAPLRRYLELGLARILSRSTSAVTGETEFDEAKYQRLASEGVRFNDLPIELRVVSADIISNAIAIFPSGQNGGQEKVADALVASLAIPFLFKPRFTAAALYVDGGLVSNIPAWIFRRHRNLDPDSHVLAVAIAPDTADERIPRFLADRETDRSSPGLFPKQIANIKAVLRNPVLSFIWPFKLFSNTIYTAIFGARSLELDAAERLDAIVLRSSFHLLDFDRKPVEVAAELAEQRRAATEQLRSIFLERPRRFADFCAQVKGDLYKKAQDLGHGADQLEADPDGRVRRLRFALAKRQTNIQALKIIRTIGFENDVDDRLLLPFRATLEGRACEAKRQLFALRKHLDFALDGRDNRYRRAAKWPHLEWCWAIPLTKGDRQSDCDFVFIIESDIDIKKFGLGAEAERASEGVALYDTAVDQTEVLSMHMLAKHWVEHAIANVAYGE